MIEAYRFGSYIIDGEEYKWDIRIFNKRPEEYKLKEEHKISLDDVEDFFKTKPKFIVIGTGSSGMAKVEEEVKQKADEENIKLIIEKTPLAVEEYNRLLKEKKDACAIMHGTC
jgi:hypothetical protein